MSSYRNQAQQLSHALLKYANAGAENRTAWAVQRLRHAFLEKQASRGLIVPGFYKRADGLMSPEEVPPDAAQGLQQAASGGGPSLGDPNYWSGGSQQGSPQPQDAEEAVSLLPGGTFQGLNMKVTPEGEKSVNVKVTPEALQDPQSLATFFQTEPGMKIEIAPPETPAVQVAPAPGTPAAGGGMGGAPQPGM